MKQGLISDLLEYYYSESRFEEELNRALDEFFNGHAGKLEFIEAEQQIVMGLFNEWLVYDFKLNDSKTLLENFCADNPYDLSREELADYTELLENEFGLYEILRIRWHKGLALLSLQTGKEYFVKEKRGTEEAKIGQLIFGRVAKVGDYWEMVGTDAPILPMKMGADTKKYFSQMKDRFTPKEVYELFYGKKGKEDESKHLSEKDIKKAKANFQCALENLELANLISAETVEKWIRNSEIRENPAYYVSLIYGLLDKAKEYDQKELNELATVFSDFHNAIPQKSLDDKSPNELKAEQKEGKADWNFEITSMGSGEWVEYQQKALECFKEDRPQRALKYYTSCFESLLTEKAVEREIYRIFANMAVTCFQLGDEYEGATLLEMALEINPNYDFAQNMQKKYVEGDFANTISLGIFSGIEERRNDPDSPMNKWDYDEISNNWPVEKILAQLKEYGIEIDRETFRNKAQKYFSIGDFERESLYPLFKGAEKDSDFVWMAAYGLWKKWCPDFLSIELLSEKIENFWETIFNEAGAIDRKKTEKELAYFEEIVVQISPEFLKRWKKNIEHFSDAPNLSVSLCQLAGTRLEKRASDLAKRLNEKTGDGNFLLVDVYVSAYHDKDWRNKLVEISKIMQYEYRIYLEIAEFFHNSKNKFWEKECLEGALKVVQKRDQDKMYDLDDSENTIFEDYADVLERLEKFYTKQKDDGKKAELKEIRRDIKERKEILSQSQRAERFQEKAEKTLNEFLQKRFENNPAKRYFDFLKKLEINFATKELTKSHITIIGSKKKIGRNDPCPCGSGKKYKKCCGK